MPNERALNRATLERQLLLQRSKMSPADTVEHLLGINAQLPLSPYVALWTRLDGFAHEELSRLIREGAVARGPLMRATVHMTTARDYPLLRAISQAVLDRSYTGQAFNKQIASVPRPAILALGESLLRESPRTRADLSRLLARRWPGVDASALGHAVAYLVPMVQLPPRGVWGEPTQAQPLLALASSWLRAPVVLEPTVEQLETVVLCYLAAFGPATVKDIQQWSGRTRLKEVTDGLGSRLLRLDDGYLDVPEAPRPDPDVEAPVRFLPEYDNLLLSHAVRTRFVPEGRKVPLPPGKGASIGTVLVDGFYRADWRVEAKALVVQPFVKLPKRDSQAVEEEGSRLSEFLGLPHTSTRVLPNS